MKRELKKLDKLTTELIKSHKISLYLINELTRIYEDLQQKKHSDFISDGVISILEKCGLEVGNCDISFNVHFKTPKKRQNRNI